MIGSVLWIIIGLAIGGYNTWQLVTQLWPQYRRGVRTTQLKMLLALNVITGPVLLLYVVLSYF